MIIDEVEKGWALRSLREAKTKLSIAERTPIFIEAVGRALEAMRDAQRAIYYSLGSPSFLGPKIYTMAVKSEATEDPLLSLLIGLEKIIQRISRKSFLPGAISREDVLREAEFFINVATQLIESLIGGKVEE